MTSRASGSSPPGTSRPPPTWPTAISRAGGGIGTALVVPGPGLLNATAALNTAYAASSPVMMVSGQIERDLIGVNRGMLHEVDDQLDIMKTVTKFARGAMDPAEVPETVHEAFPSPEERPPASRGNRNSAGNPGRSGRRGAAGAGSAPAAAPDAGRIAEAARMLAAAENPLIWAGGGTIRRGLPTLCGVWPSICKCR